jgi:hypothetical protein
MRILVILLIFLVAACAQAQAAHMTDIEVFYTNGSYALRSTNTIDAAVLSANTADAFTVPTDSETGKKANYVVFASNCDFYLNTSATAAVPGSDVTNGTASEMNPTVRFLGGTVSTLSLISASSCIVTMSFYR